HALGVAAAARRGGRAAYGLLPAQNAALGLPGAFTGSRSAVPLPLAPRAAATASGHGYRDTLPDRPVVGSQRRMAPSRWRPPPSAGGGGSSGGGGGGGVLGGPRRRRAGGRGWGGERGGCPGGKTPPPAAGRRSGRSAGRPGPGRRRAAPGPSPGTDVARA